jgi:hypothetical protein
VTERLTEEKNNRSIAVEINEELKENDRKISII